MKKLLSVFALLLCTISSMADNKIYYTSYYGNVEEPSEPDAFGANIVSNTYVNGQGVITFDGEVTTIGEGAFRITGLASIVIPNSVTQLGNYAFYQCYQLKSINIPNSVTSIGDAAFLDCENLQIINIPNSVVSIGKQVFYGCTNLSSVSFGNSLTSIGYGCFIGCDNLKKVYCYAESVPSVSGFGSGFNCDKLYVPASSLSLYSAAWGSYFNSILPITDNDNGKKEMSELLEQLLNGENASRDIQIVYNECLDILEACTSEEETKQKFIETCKPKLFNVWIAEKKAQVEAAKKGVNKDYMNEIYTEVMNNIGAAAAEENVGAVRQAVTSGIGAITAARILYKHLEQGIVPEAKGAGMRMKVTTTSNKTYEFKTQDLQSVEYYKKN